MSVVTSPLAEFLRARRELLQPEEVGIERDPNRRVTGLRRREVADLAGISVDYYLRIEQGRDSQPSDQVLAAIARALLLDSDERAYLHRLAHSFRDPGADRDGSPAGRPSDSVLQLLRHWSATPAYVSDRNHDILAANAVARSLTNGVVRPGANLLLSLFDPEVKRDLAATWEPTALSLVSALRFNSDPRGRRMRELVGILSVQDREFRRMWARHDAHPRTSGLTRARVDSAGWVDFRWQTFEIAGEGGQFLTTFFGEPGSVAEAIIARLAAAQSSAISAESAR